MSSAQGRRNQHVRPHVNSDMSGNLGSYASRRMAEPYPSAGMPHHHNLQAHSVVPHGMAGASKNIHHPNVNRTKEEQINVNYFFSKLTKYFLF